MKNWSAISKTALLGTQRASLPQFRDQGPLEELLGSLNDETPEHKLLQVVGILGLHEQIGQLPEQLIPNPDSPSSKAFDDQPSCPNPAAERLSAMLDGRFRELLPEFLSALHESNQRLPAVLLPDFLERGVKSPLLRPYILPVLGERGRWLAAQNQAWSYASLAVEDWNELTRQWRSDKKIDRHALLCQLRHTHPETGRQLLESTWKSESPISRTSLIKLMEVGLTMSDEPFLESVLDDRHLPVRRKAGEFLACLPKSRLCQRMIVNTQYMLRWQPDAAHQIDVSFPMISDQLVRDGVTREIGKDPARGRSKQLIQMIGAVPLETWTERWEAPPKKIVAAMITSRWPRTLTQALMDAAHRQKNVPWAWALLTTADIKIVAPKLISILPLDLCKELVYRYQNEMDGDLPLEKESPLLRVLRYWPHAWDETMIQTWSDYLVDQIKRDNEDRPAVFLRTAVKQLARACPPDAADRLIQKIEPFKEKSSGWQLALSEMINILIFRRDMYNDIERQK